MIIVLLIFLRKIEKLKALKLTSIKVEGLLEIIIKVTDKEHVIAY